MLEDASNWGLESTCSAGIIFCAKDWDQTGFEGTLLVCHSRKDKTGRLLTMFFLTILYIPISKFAVDSLIWKDSLFFAGTCYTTIGFNWVILRLSEFNDRYISYFRLLLLWWFATLSTFPSFWRGLSNGIIRLWTNTTKQVNFELKLTRNTTDSWTAMKVLTTFCTM